MSSEYFNDDDDNDKNNDVTNERTSQLIDCMLVHQNGNHCGFPFQFMDIAHQQ